ncbi:hypothetical protein Plhal304r1_c035g0108371 [Plasmopara halstedii]
MQAMLVDCRTLEGGLVWSCVVPSKMERCKDLYSWLSVKNVSVAPDWKMIIVEYYDALSGRTF